MQYFYILSSYAWRNNIDLQWILLKFFFALYKNLKFLEKLKWKLKWKNVVITWFVK